MIERISIRLNKVDGKILHDKLALHPQHTITSYVRERIFGRRQRSKVIGPLDNEIAYGKISNLLSCIIDDYMAKHDIRKALLELQEIVKLRKSRLKDENNQ